MLTVSSKSKYGLLAVLALANHYRQGLLQIKEIASQKNIPHQYLVQIFNLLGKADVIQSVRGKNGGYQLSRNPANITVLEVIEILEGGIEFIQEQDSANAVFEFLHDAESKLRSVFDVSLAYLLTRQQEKDRVLMFDI